MSKRWRKFYIRRGDPLDDGICTSYNELGDRCVLPVGHAVDHSPVQLPPGSCHPADSAGGTSKTATE